MLYKVLILSISVCISFQESESLMAAVDPKRGHHVINNGVRKALPSIIDDFLKMKGRKFNDLALTEAQSVWMAHERPLIHEDLKQIDQMTVMTPAKQQHTDQNDQEYGKVMEQLRAAVVTCLDLLFEEFESGQVKNDFKIKQQFFIITGLVERFNSIDNEIYFDHQALGWWCSKGGDMADYRSVRDHVAGMFNKLTDRSVLLTWITELQQVLS